MRIFVAMENVLTKQTNITNSKELYEKDYFFRAKPQKNVIEDITRLIKNNYDIYIVDNYFTDSNYALSEKKRWIKKHLPDISASHVFLIPYNQSFVDYLNELNISPLKSDDFLLDNYKNNLSKWEDNGGSGIYISYNSITAKNWLGKKVVYQNDKINNYFAILSIIDLKAFNHSHEFLDEFLNFWGNKEIKTNDKFITAEFKLFAEDYKKMLQSLCLNINFELVSDYQNFYSFDFVLKSNYTDFYYLISIPDIRFTGNDWQSNILYKTMAYSEDWFGGENNYSSLETLGDKLTILDKQRKQKFKNNVFVNQASSNSVDNTKGKKYVKLEDIKTINLGNDLIETFSKYANCNPTAPIENLDEPLSVQTEAESNISDAIVQIS